MHPNQAQTPRPTRPLHYFQHWGSHPKRSLFCWTAHARRCGQVAGVGLHGCRPPNKKWFCRKGTRPKQKNIPDMKQMDLTAPKKKNFCRMKEKTLEKKKKKTVWKETNPALRSYRVTYHLPGPLGQLRSAQNPGSPLYRYFFAGISICR